MHTHADLPIVAVTATTEYANGRARVRLNAAYTRSIEQAGLIPLVVPPLANADAAPQLLRAVRGLVLTGGEDVDPARYGAPPHPALGALNEARDATELALARGARDLALPTLAICRGMQLLNVAMGGTLVQDLPSERPGSTVHDQGDARSRRTHDVAVVPGSRLARSLGIAELGVNSIHHQSVDRLARGLRVTAHAPDGVVEGAESVDEGWWAVAVQWHPEELTDGEAPWDRELFSAFAARVRGG